MGTWNISSEDFFIFLERAFDGMLAILEELGDERANQKPSVPGANSPYATLFHCVGVTNYWIGTLLGGRDVPRDHARREPRARQTQVQKAGVA